MNFYYKHIHQLHLLKLNLFAYQYTLKNLILPFDTLFPVVMKKSLVPITLPSSEVQVSPLTHASAPLKQIANNSFKIHLANFF